MMSLFLYRFSFSFILLFLFLFRRDPSPVPDSGFLLFQNSLKRSLKVAFLYIHQASVSIKKS